VVEEPTNKTGWEVVEETHNEERATRRFPEELVARKEVNA
jgi:hypothetical protein